MMINKRISTPTLELWLNALAICGIILLLALAFAFQFWLKELPCPLCLLQRIGFVATCIGFLLNLHYGFRPSHYALSLVAALFTAFVALRQIALHIIPGDEGYGSAIFGLHMYTWSFIISMLIVLFTTVILGFDIQYNHHRENFRRFKFIIPLLFVLVLLMAFSNFISTAVECGFRQCPDNPVNYLW